jgi:hypothetical protein
MESLPTLYRRFLSRFYTSAMLAMRQDFLQLLLGSVLSSSQHLIVNSGYELPRLNERLVYLVTFSIHTAIAYGLFQRAAHRTFLPYTSVSVSLAVVTTFLMPCTGSSSNGASTKRTKTPYGCWPFRPVFRHALSRPLRPC